MSDRLLSSWPSPPTMVALAIPFDQRDGWPTTFGAKTIFRLAIGVFMVGSLFCAVSVHWQNSCFALLAGLWAAQ